MKRRNIRNIIINKRSKRCDREVLLMPFIYLISRYFFGILFRSEVFEIMKLICIRVYIYIYIHTHTHTLTHIEDTRYRHLWADCVENVWTSTSRNPIGLHDLFLRELIGSENEYISVVWNYITSANAKKLKRAQHKFAALCFNRFFLHVHYRFSYSLEHLKFHFIEEKIWSQCTVPWENTSWFKNLAYSLFENYWPSSPCPIYPRLACLVSAPEVRITRIIQLDAVQLLITVCIDISRSKHCLLIIFYNSALLIIRFSVNICVNNFSRRLKPCMIALIELVLLSKWYRFPCFVHILVIVYDLFSFVASAYFVIDWLLAVE
jgi:hypothetical protein